MPTPRARAETSVHNIVEDLRHLAVRTSDLVLDPRPHRIHPPAEIEALKASLTRYGQDQPLVVQREGMIVRIGNRRLKAARDLGWTHVAAIVLDREEAEMVARGILDNRVADMARSDRDVIAALLADLQGVDATLPTGFDDRELAELLDRLEAKQPPLEESPAEEEPPDASGIALGAAWRLGNHVLLCGDSCSEASVGRAFELAGGTADVILTDPPYGVGYTGVGGKRRAIANDAGLDYRAFFARFLRLARMSKRNTAHVFMAGQELHNLRLALATRASRGGTTSSGPSSGPFSVTRTTTPATSSWSTPGRGATSSTGPSARQARSSHSTDPWPRRAPDAEADRAPRAPAARRLGPRCARVRPVSRFGLLADRVRDGGPSCRRD